MQINPSLLPHLEKIRKNHHLSLILLHGSQAEGKTHPKSDLDIAVVSRKNSPALDTLRLISDLSQTFPVSQVDLTDATHANPLLLYAIARNSQLLSGTQSDYDSFQYLAFHRYSDYLPFLKAERSFVQAKLKSYVAV